MGRINSSEEGETPKMSAGEHAMGSIEQKQGGNGVAVSFPPAQPVGKDGYNEAEGADNLVYGHPPFPQTAENQIGEPWTTGLFDCQQHQTNDQKMGRINSSEEGETPKMSAGEHAMGSIEQKQGGNGVAVSFPPAQTVGKDGYNEAVGADNLVYGQPPFPQTAENQIGEPWTTGLFDCQQHQTNAVMTSYLPCVTFGQISEILDEGEMTCPLGSFIYLLMMPALCSQWIMGSKYRAKLRKKYNLVEAPYEDWASHVFCPCCSLCQEFRELKNRGIDPALGWNGYLAEQQAKRQGTYEDQVKTPPQYQTMFK